MRVEEIILNKERNVTLTAYIQTPFTSAPIRPGVLLIPGGGYQLCAENEIDSVAPVYLQMGYHVFVLRYSVGEHAGWPNPLRDYEAAMKLIRSRAGEWHLYENKIAVVGFSAGGHLAACGAVMPGAQYRPNALILGYPVINDENAKRWEKTAPGILDAVDGDICPCFVFATRNDATVPVENTLQFIAELEKYQVPFECHIYAYGPHGFSTGDPSVFEEGDYLCGRARHWMSDSREWLEEIFGKFSGGYMTDPV